MLHRKLQFRDLPRAVRLPLVVKSILLEVPVHRPVIHHLAPVLDGAAHFCWNIIERNHKIGERQGQFALLDFRFDGECAQLEEMNVALFDGLLFQHFAGNFFERCVHPGLGCDLFGGFVQLESEFPAQDVYGGLLRRVRTFAGGFPYFGGDGVHVSSGDGCVYGGHVYHATGFDTMQPGVAADRGGVVKLEDELAVGGLAFFLFF